MSSDLYRTHITASGHGLERDAKFNKTVVDLTELVVGSGQLPAEQSPAAQTALITQEKIYGLTIEKDPDNAGVWIARAEIPADEGGFFIHEAGIKAADGSLYAYSRLPGDYKPLLAEGAGKSYTIRLKFVPGDASTIEIKIDPSVQFATPTDLKNSEEAHKAVSQFLPWDAERIYKTGEICTIEQNGELVLMQMYAGPNLTCVGKNPADPLNRHEGWADQTKPFWWIPYTGGRVGMPFWWLRETPPEEAVMEHNVNLPIAVYWRLAREYPALVSNGFINTGEIRGEYLRVLDAGRGADPGRAINSWQGQRLPTHTHATVLVQSGSSLEVSRGGIDRFSVTESLDVRNVARSMAIYI